MTKIRYIIMNGKYTELFSNSDFQYEKKRLGIDDKLVNAYCMVKVGMPIKLTGDLLGMDYRKIYKLIKTYKIDMNTSLNNLFLLCYENLENNKQAFLKYKDKVIRQVGGNPKYALISLYMRLKKREDKSFRFKHNLMGMSEVTFLKNSRIIEKILK